MPTPTPQEMAAFREAFQRFDTDGNQALDADELAAMMRALGADLDASALATMMREADVDRDGRISFEEFVDAMAASAGR